MIHIQQRTPYSCGIAALQMITGLSTEVIHTILGYSPDSTNSQTGMPYGMSEMDMVAILFHFGHCPTYIVTQEYLVALLEDTNLSERIKISTAHPKKDELFDMLQGRTAVLCTRNHHVVIWDSFYILDPSKDTVGATSLLDYDICGAIFTVQPTNKEVTH